MSCCRNRSQCCHNEIGRTIVIFERGPRGPRGFTGPQGPIGPQGPRGFTGATEQVSQGKTSAEGEV